MDSVQLAGWEVSCDGRWSLTAAVRGVVGWARDDGRALGTDGFGAVRLADTAECDDGLGQMGGPEGEGRWDGRGAIGGTVGWDGGEGQRRWCDGRGRFWVVPTNWVK